MSIALKRLNQDAQRAHPEDAGVVAVSDEALKVANRAMRLAKAAREQLPPGWVMHASGRSGGFRLRVPNSRSEEDYAIDMEWIVTSDQPGRERLLTVTQAALADLQAAIVEATSSSWPSRGSDVDLPEPHAEIAGDTVNPILRLFYGPSHAPVIELQPQILLNMVLDG